MPTILSQYGNGFIDKIAILSNQKKILLGCCFLQRQITATERFDVYYHQSTSNHFIFYIRECVKSIHDVTPNNAAIKNLLKDAYDKTPDTEIYPETEGVLAKNAFLSVCFLFRFLSDFKIEHILNVIEKYLESIEAQEFSKNEDYDEDRVFSDEMTILDALISKISALNDLNMADVKAIIGFSGQYSL